MTEKNELQTIEKMGMREFFNSNDVINAISAALGQDAQKSERYIRGVMTTIFTDQTGMLKKCSKLSILNAMLTAAQLRMPVDARGHAYLIPFKNRDKGEMNVQFIPGYKGYISKIRSNPTVATFFVETVYSCDEFRVELGSSPKITHIPAISSPDYGLDDKITYFYAVVTFKSGGQEFEVMTRKEVDKIKNAAKTQKIWGPYYAEMGKKTVIRRFEKKLQFDDLADINMIDNLIHDGGSAHIGADGQLVAGREVKQVQESPDADYSMSDEKKKLIQDCYQAYEILGYNESKQIMQNKELLRVTKMEDAKVENLTLLRSHLNTTIDKIDSEAN
jgi:recombination protein RecT